MILGNINNDLFSDFNPSFPFLLVKSDGTYLDEWGDLGPDSINLVKNVIQRWFKEQEEKDSFNSEFKGDMILVDRRTMENIIWNPWEEMSEV